jgi:cytosine/adenosine deaminase-related metal-dependent hydrolase
MLSAVGCGSAALRLNTFSVDGKPIYLRIARGRIMELRDGHQEENGVTDMTDSVVLPPIIDAHNHPAPYNLASNQGVTGQSAQSGSYRSRFEWIPLYWKNKEPKIRARKNQMVSAFPKTAYCDMLYYTSLLDVGAAVIQGYVPAYYRECRPFAGEPLGRTVPGLREGIWIWHPSDRLEPGKSKKRLQTDVLNLLTGNPMVFHLAEGAADDENVRRELEYAYYVGLMAPPGKDDSAKRVVLHGIGLGDEEFKTMSRHGWGVIWSPVTQKKLYGEKGMLPVRHVRDLGVTIGLGCDWALTGSQNILREMREAQATLVDSFGYERLEAAFLV